MCHRDMESCAQYFMTNVNVDQDAIGSHFGDRIAPGGYAWVFPKGDDSANIGLGVVALRAGGDNARQWLDDDTQLLPHRREARLTVGGVIVHPTIRRTVTDGLITCGDAAHMINPLSGGGIVNAMKAGRLAAEVGAAALAAHDTSAARLQRYQRRVDVDARRRSCALSPAQGRAVEVRRCVLRQPGGKTVNLHAAGETDAQADFRERADALPDAPAGGGEVFRVSACAGSTVPTTARERQSGSATVSDPNCFTAETQRSQRLA